MLHLTACTYQNVWSSRSVHVKRSNKERWVLHSIAQRKTWRIQVDPRETSGKNTTPEEFWVHTCCINCYIFVDDISRDRGAVHRRHLMQLLGWRASQERFESFFGIVMMEDVSSFFPTSNPGWCSKRRRRKTENLLTRRFCLLVGSVTFFPIFFRKGPLFRSKF